MNGQLEICCYSFESASIAANNGASRIELCANYMEGGTTPSYATIKQTIEALSIPVNVIIRPRGGDFLYSDIEFQNMLSDLKMVKELGGNGVVVGCLKENGEFDLDQMRQIVELSSGMELVCHRAFDMCSNPEESIEQLIDLGFQRILTSGCHLNAIEGKEQLKRFVELAGDQISIMPGAGINSNNLAQLKDYTQANEFHASAKTFVTSKMKYFNPKVSMGGGDPTQEYKTIIVNANEVKAMAELLKTT